MKKIIFIFLSVIVLNYTKLFAQNVVLVTRASHYSVVIKNTTPYHLKVSFISNGNDLLSKTFNPDQEETISKTFSKRKLSNSKIKVSYNDETFQIDKTQAYNNLISNLNSITNSRGYREREVRTEFYTRFACAIKSSDNDGGILTNAARLCQFYYNWKDNINYFSNKSYRNLSDFLIDLGKHHIESEIVDEVGRMIERDYGTNKKLNSNVVKACMFLIQGLEAIPEQIENEKIRANNNYSNYLNTITSMKSSNNFNSVYYANIPSGADFRTVTPNFTINIEPLVFGGNLNSYWEAGPHIQKSAFVPSTSTSQSDQESTTLYPSYGANFSFAISPEIRFGSSDILSKLYATVGYYKYGYSLANVSYSLSNSLFSQTPTPSNGFETEFPIGYYQTTYMFGATYSVQFNTKIVLNLSGGYLEQQGTLDFSKANLRNGYAWKFTNLNITDKSYNPYCGVQIGYGKSKKHSGYHITLGTVFFKSQNNINTNEYYLKDASTKSIIDFNSNAINYKINLGVSLSF